MQIVIAAVGKPRDRGIATAVQEYERRAARYWPLRIREVKEESSRSIGAEQVRAREAERLLTCASASAQLVACVVDGEQMESETFAAWLRDARTRAAADLVFLIGGAFGLAASVRERAHTRLSFSRWTLPHELARLVLAEQLYRAGTLVRGEPYHK
ncbi:MAG: 23S rRNA (pseudouridine(1915)-N(3))-methyltransferase RlmH [Gemmatimonadota bacterium]|nr:23S rRNA (pseudouridine(1915)-N(3))-methyltransferase RlmH [Gemmatimonadota bacterium]